MNGSAIFGSVASGRSTELRRRIFGVIITTSSVWFFCAALLRNSRPSIGMSPMPGIFCSVDVIAVVHQAGDRERLAVPQLELGLGAARRERRDAEALQRRRRW